MGKRQSRAAQDFAMSDFSLTLVLHLKTSKIINDMAKVSIKSEKITPFGGIFHVRELFSRYVGPVIDKVLGLRCTSYGYQYSEIVGSLSSVYFCGGDCVEDVTSHLMPHLSLHPTLRTCSSDTILRGISELATANTTYTSDTGKSYDFNTATKLNSLLVKVLKNTGQLMAGESYDLDFDHQFIETEKYDAKMTYKKFTGYSPGVAVIGDLIVGIENRDGNANVRFHQQDTLERIFDDMNNGFGWARLPKSFMAENTVFLLLTAMIRNFYKFLIGRLDAKAFGLEKCSRIKAFVFKFISVPAKWIRTARHYELNIYTHNHSYQKPFALADG